METDTQTDRQTDRRMDRRMSQTALLCRPASVMGKAIRETADERKKRQEFQLHWLVTLNHWPRTLKLKFHGSSFLVTFS